jgi:uncharacterized protein (TIGR01777 family)
MKVIITGGTGLIGRALAQALRGEGCQVWVLSRSAKKASPAPGVQVVQWDGETAEGWGQLVNEADALVNLAGENIGAGRWTKERKQRILSSRVSAGRAVTVAVQQASHRPKVLVQASAVGYYGVYDDRPLDEVSPAGSDYLAHTCMDWEATTQAVEQMGVRRVVVRTGVVLDKKEGALPRMLMPFRLMAGGPLGSGRQWLPWIHLRDEVDAMRFLIKDESARGAFNLTAPQPLTNAEFGKVIARVLRRPYWLPAPAFALRLLLGEMSTLVLDGQRPYPRRLQAMGYRFHFDEAEEALKDVLR